MVQGTERYKAEDEATKARTNARNGLGSYCYTLRSTVLKKKVKEKINDSDEKASEDKITTVLA